MTVSVCLKDRGFIYIEGEDRYSFLHSLVSNDILNLPQKNAVYTCLLTPQGKFLHDFFVIEGMDYILVDCEGGDRALDLFAYFNHHRLRSNIKMNCEEHSPIYAVFNPDQTPQGGYLDPRHPDMGYRCFEKPQCKEEDFFLWDLKRIILGIPDGSRDMDIGRSTLLECNIEKYNGIDWNKGCYVGQELTARMYHRGLAKKHLYTVRFIDSAPDPFTDIIIDGKNIGQMRSSCDNTGLALLKDGHIKNIPPDYFTIL